MRTTVTLDRDIYEAVRSLAASQRRSFGAVLSELVRRGLTPNVKTRKKQGFPVVTLPQGSPAVTPDVVEAALEGDE